jgi:hypothetical protein
MGGIRSMIKLKLFSERIELNAAQQANQYPFVATITYGGKLSDGFVGGTENIPGGPYRVLISAELLRKKIKSLAGKAVFVSDLHSHENNYKIGTFLQAWVESEELPDGTTALAAKASGLITENADNSEMIQKILDEARDEKLGFSYDIKNVSFELKAGAADSSTSEQYVQVTDFEWRGATVLKRDAAAYEETRLAASKAKPKGDEDDMTPEQLREALTPLIAPIQSGLSELRTEVATLKAEQAALKAGAASPNTQQPQTSGNSVTAKDFAAGIAAAIVEANKPMQEALTKLTESVANKGENKPAGVRRSMGPAEFQAKYQMKPDPEMSFNTSTDIRNAIESIHASTMPVHRKEKIVAELGAMRRALLHDEMVNGGVN